MTKWILASVVVGLLGAGIFIAPAAARYYAATHFDASVENVELPRSWKDLCTVDVRIRNRSAFNPKLQHVHVELSLRGRKLAATDWPGSSGAAPLPIPAGGSAPLQFKLKIGTREVWNLIRGTGYPAEVKVDGTASLAGLQIPFHVVQEKRLPFIPCCVEHKDEPEPLQK
jgi:hypothetical protein